MPIPSPDTEADAKLSCRGLLLPVRSRPSLHLDASSKQQSERDEGNSFYEEIVDGGSWQDWPSNSISSSMKRGKSSGLSPEILWQNTGSLPLCGLSLSGPFTQNGRRDDYCRLSDGNRGAIHKALTMADFARDPGSDHLGARRRGRSDYAFDQGDGQFRKCGRFPSPAHPRGYP